MARAQKTSGANFWIGKNINTTDQQKIEIVDNILGIDLDDEENHEVAEQIMSKIRSIVGAYEGAVESVDKAPKPANFVNELNGTKKNKDGTIKDGVRRQAFDLLSSLTGMSYWMTDEFVQTQGYDLKNFELELAGFFDVCTKIAKKYEDMPSSGRPKGSAKRIIVNDLNAVFEEYYSIPALDDSDNENDLRRNVVDNERAKFIRCCLEIDKISCPKTDAALLNLIYSKDTPSEERLSIKRF